MAWIRQCADAAHEQACRGDAALQERLRAEIKTLDGQRSGKLTGSPNAVKQLRKELTKLINRKKDQLRQLESATPTVAPPGPSQALTTSPQHIVRLLVFGIANCDRDT
eukprot:s3466_g7.t1